jgi:hypothetical protein
VGHPYELFYLIWKLSWLYGRCYADHSLGFEQLLAQPERELRALLDIVGLVDVAPASLVHLIDRQPQGKWRAYADDAWFAKRESRCESLLRAWNGGRVSSPHARNGG